MAPGLGRALGADVGAPPLLASGRRHGPRRRRQVGLLLPVVVGLVGIPATPPRAGEATRSGRLPVPSLAATTDDVLHLLATDASRGLTSDEAARRLVRHGANELPRQRPASPWRILGRQAMDVMVLVLFAAVALSLLLGHRVEAIAITAIAAFTIGLGFIQEWRAERALEALRRLSAPRATVVRDGAAETVESRAVVPGDILVVTQGDIVAADARILQAVELQVAEASLTGESLPVAKRPEAAMRTDLPLGDRTSMLHASTVLTYGRALAVVTATGRDTEVGRIGTLLAAVRPERTPLQRQLARLARGLLSAGAVSVAAIVAVGLARSEPLLEMLLFGVAVAVAVVPEALPAVVTISLAIGAQRMAGRQTLVRRLPTVETLGSTTVICSDKTGTLTMGQMAVTLVQTPRARYTVESSGYVPIGRIQPDPAGDMLELARAAALCNDADLRQSGPSWVVQGDPTEGALLVFARKAGLDPEAVAQWPREHELPFSSERKRMTTMHRVEGRLVAYSKGAPEAILASCASAQGQEGFTDMQRAAWREAAEGMAGDGLRVLALARKEAPRTQDVEAGMEFLGLVGILDVPRPEAREAIRTCRSAGIRPIMITGDHALTASAVARGLGILTDGHVVTGPEVQQASDQELADRVERIQVYARVSPAHKLRIVEAWQAKGHVVAVTGDGVNDAPALRKADVGVAMGVTGTDVAKEAAGVVLADDNFATIVAAVEEGRGIHDNIRKYLMFLLSTNFGEILLIAATMALGLPLPLTALQILYVNLASDGLPALALAVDPHEPDAMRRRPRRPGDGILSRPVVGFMLAAGLASAIANLGVFLWALGTGRPLQEAMTMVFVSLVLIQLLKAYTFRTLARPIWQRPFANKWLNAACAWELGLLALLVYVPFLEAVFGTRPLPLADWAVILGAALAVGVALEALKALMRPWLAGPERVPSEAMPG